MAGASSGMCASQTRASTGISVSLGAARLPPLVGDLAGQLAGRRQRPSPSAARTPRRSWCRPTSAPASRHRRPPRGRAATRTARAAAGSCCARTACFFGTQRESKPRTLRLVVAAADRLERLPQPADRRLADELVAARALLLELRRRAAAASASAAAAAGPLRRAGRRAPRLLRGGGAVAATAGELRRRLPPTRGRTRPAAPSSDRIRYASVSSAARSAAMLLEFLAEVLDLVGMIAGDLQRGTRA